jgi:PAS domain S-box-containing protein
VGKVVITLALGLIIGIMFCCISESVRLSDEEHCGGLSRLVVAAKKLFSFGHVAPSSSDPTPSSQRLVSQYKSLTDNIAASIMLHEHTGEIAWCSPYTEVLTGYSRAEIDNDKSKFFENNVFEEDFTAFQRAFGIVTSGEPYQYRYRFRHKSGVLLWLETRAVPVYHPKSTSHMCLTITIDVTASVHDQLKLEERNRDLNDFTYMISHDLRAPILTLQGMVGVLEEQLALSTGSELGTTIAHMRKSIARLESLVGGILELAQISVSECANEGVPLADVFTEVISDYEMEIKKAGVNIKIPAELPVVSGKSKFLYHIFANLLSNAIKYKDEERALEIEVACEYIAAKRRFSISFRDNGRGIPKEYHKEIFKPFVRIEGGQEEGCGVGLATVSKLVEKIGGRIVIENAEPGTEFVFELRRPL